jgi:hypothetical protein
MIENLLEFIKSFTEALPASLSTHTDVSPRKHLSEQLYKKELGASSLPHLVKLSIEFMSTLIN